MVEAVWTFLTYFGALCLVGSLGLFLFAWLHRRAVDRQEQDDDEYFETQFGDDDK